MTRRSQRCIRWATFDCYGTLIDWERGITRAAELPNLGPLPDVLDELIPHP